MLPVLQPGELCSAHPDPAIATFEDANLEAAVRAELEVGAQEDLTCSLVSGVMGLSAPSAGIGSLVGIQNLTSLRNLILDGNLISDISALSGLTGLTTLYLYGNVPLIDIGALSGLTSLTHLDLRFSSVTDIQPLLDNSGLGIGDTVLLAGTDVSCTDVAALEGKGVEVQSDCP